MIGVAAVEPVNRDIAARDPKRFQAAVAAEYRRAGGEDAACCIDEAAATAGNAVRVGHDHLGALAGDFDIAVQLAAAGAGDFVQDDARLPARRQVRIAADIAALLGVRGAGGVVEDGATLIDIELRIVVVRYACRIGRDDLHNGQSVGRLINGGALPAGVWIGDDLRPHRGDCAE